jgi:uncharacterized protein
MLHRPQIDGFEFAKAGSKLSGEWPLADFPRLRGELHSDRGALHFELEGVPIEQGHPALRLRVTGVLDLTCQRCLEALERPLHAEAMLLLYGDDREFAALPVDAEGPERILAANDMVVRDLIEDEVLRAIPYAPRHERCESRTRDEISPRLKPFASLRSLLDTKR